MESLAKFNQLEREGSLTGRWKTLTQVFCDSYLDVFKKTRQDLSQGDRTVCTLIDLIVPNIASPHPFAPYHQRICTPFDYYSFGLEFVRPMVDISRSHVYGIAELDAINEQLMRGENVILFGNHQSEFDPQILSLLLEKSHPKIAQEIIFVAGHRVTTDPIAIPFSLGRNLLCIYSKKRIDHPPEEKEKKLLHNTKTMALMHAMLSKGGVCIYVAPSGGRDRPNAAGQVEVAPFDGASVEMFSLMARKAKTPTHFYPLTLDTFQLLPPPVTLVQDLGEIRILNYTPLQAHFGPQIHFDAIPRPASLDKRESREVKARWIHSLVNKSYMEMRSALSH